MSLMVQASKLEAVSKTINSWLPTYRKGGGIVDKHCSSTIRAHDEAIYGIVVTIDGTVWTGGSDRAINGWRNSECIASLRGHEGDVNLLIEGNDGSIWSASDDTTIKHWKDKTCIATLIGHKEWIIALLHSGDCLWSGSRDKTIKKWKSYSCEFTLKGHTDYVCALAIAPNGCLVSGSFDKSLRIWDDDRCLCTIRMDYSIYNISFSSNKFMWLQARDPKNCKKAVLVRYNLVKLLFKNVKFVHELEHRSMNELKNDSAEIHRSRFFSSSRVIASSINGDFYYQGSFLIQDPYVWVLRGNQILALKGDSSLVTLSDHLHEIKCVAMGKDGSMWTADASGCVKRWETISASIKGRKVKQPQHPSAIVPIFHCVLGFVLFVLFVLIILVPKSYWGENLVLKISRKC